MQRALSGSTNGLLRWWTPRRRELVLLLLATVFSIVVHAHYRVTGFGETDAARIAREAIGWHLQGFFTPENAGYTHRTSAMYMQFEKVILDHGLPIRLLPAVMNWISVVLGTGCSLALYGLFRMLKGPRIAAAAVIVHALSPGFWSGNIYGMPTVPGLFFFVLALIAFLAASREDEVRKPRFAAFVLLSWLGLFVALGCKADLALSTGAFLAVVLAAPRVRRWPLLFAGAFVVGGATVGIVLYAKAIVTGAARNPGTVTFLKAWNEHFPFKLAALFTDSNNTTIVRCAGGFLFAVIALALMYGWFSGGPLRRQSSCAALWAFPPILFWGFQFDDSSRHNIPAYPPLVFIATIFLFHICAAEMRRFVPLIGCLVVVNYFSNTSGNGSIVPQSDLAGMSEKIENLTSSFHERARVLAADDSPKRLVLFASEDTYIQYEIFARAQHPRLKMNDVWEMTDGAQTTHFFFQQDRASVRAAVRRYKQDGFTILSMSRY